MENPRAQQKSRLLVIGRITEDGKGLERISRFRSIRQKLPLPQRLSL